MGIFKTYLSIKKRINQYNSYAEKYGGGNHAFLFFDCILNCSLGKCTIRDYFLNDFYLLNKRGKKQYLSGLEQNKLQNKNNDPDMELILKKQGRNSTLA